MLNDKGKINYHQFMDFVKRERIGIHFIDSQMRDLRIVQEITNNIVDELNHNEFSHMIENELINSFPTRDLSEFYADDKMFRPGTLKKFDRFNIKKYRDDQKSIYMFFKDSIIKIMADDIKVIGWGECDFNGQKVWRKNISDKWFDLDESLKYENSTWYNFCKNAVTKDGLNPLMRSLGYLIHNYKDPSIAKMIVYADGSEDSDNMTANGRSGKSLIAYEALKRIRKISFIEGKRFDDTNRFAFQTVDPLCDIVLIDDVKPDFKYKSLYNAATNYFSIEMKKLQPITMPYEESPKFLITSNYGILSSGDSDIARRDVIGFSNYYNANFSPRDDFKLNFFRDWNKKEYNWFYGFFIKSAQLYLKEGLTSFGNHNIDRKALTNVVGSDFYEWVEQNIGYYDDKTKAVNTTQLMNDIPDVFKNRFVKADKIKSNLFQIAKQLDYEVFNQSTTIGTVKGRFIWFENKNGSVSSQRTYRPEIDNSKELPF